MRSRDAPSDSPSPETAEKPKPDQTIPNQQSSRGGRVARRKHFAIRRPKLVAQSHDGSADQAKMAARARASNRTAARGRVARRKHFAIRRPKLVAQSHDGSADQAKMAA